jgi:hypothetical protein
MAPGERAGCAEGGAARVGLLNLFGGGSHVASFSILLPLSGSSKACASLSGTPSKAGSSLFTTALDPTTICTRCRSSHTLDQRLRSCSSTSMKVCFLSSSPHPHAMMKTTLSSSLGGGGARFEARSKAVLQPEISNRLVLSMTSKQSSL